MVHDTRKHLCNVLEIGEDENLGVKIRVNNQELSHVSQSISNIK